MPCRRTRVASDSLLGTEGPLGPWAKTAYDIWKENRLDQEVWQVIDKAVGSSEL